MKAKSRDYEEGQDEDVEEDEEEEEEEEIDAEEIEEEDDYREGDRYGDSASRHGKRKGFATSMLDKEEVALETILAMQVTRNTITKWLYRSFFRTELQGKQE